MTNAMVRGKLYTADRSVRVDEGNVASGTPRRGSLLGLRRLSGVIASVVALWGGLFSASAYEKLPLYATLPEWSLEWTDAAHSKGTIETDSAHGGWKLHVARVSGWYGGFALKVCNDPVTPANRGVIQGAGFLDLRGTITGPSHANVETNAVYRIGRLDDNVFRANDGNKGSVAAGTIIGLYTPGTLIEFISCFHNDGSPYSLVQDIYIVEPTLSKLPAWLCSGCRSLRYFYLDCPLMTTIDGPICNCGGPINDGVTIFDEWNLPSVTTAGAVSGTSGSFGGWGRVAGTLSLPSAQRINDSYAFASTGMGGLLLGARGDLEYVGSNAFSNCSSLTNVFLGAAPVGKRLVLGASAFASAGLKRVWFNGDRPPTFTAIPNAYTFGTSATAEGAITFYVRDTPGWAEILAEADANGGLVAASRFDTAQRQRVARFGGVVYDPEQSIGRIFDARFAETFDEQVTKTSVAGDFPYLEKGFLELPVTLTASCSDAADAKGRKAHFHRWDGAPVDVERNPSITVSDAATLRAIRPMFVHDWFYDTAAGTIENGIWTINVTVVSATGRTLRIGSTSGTVENGVTKSTAFRGRGSGEGILDFNGDVRDDQGNEWTITATSGYCMTKTEAPASVAEFQKSDYLYLPTVVVFPETLTSQAGNEFNFNNSRRWPLDEVIFIVPEYAGELNWTLNGANDMKRLLIRAPRMKTVKPNAIWQGPDLSGTDLTRWDLSGVTDVQYGAFQCGTAMRGTLSLPSLRTIGNNNFKNYSRLEGVVLSTNLTLSAVGTNVFNNCAALKTVVIGNAKGGCTVGEASFSNATKPENVVFLGQRDPAAADQVLAGTDASDGAKTATLYASSAFHWNESATALTEAERALAPTGVSGVYREGSRKAWFVARPSPFDPNGTLLLLR